MPAHPNASIKACIRVRPKKWDETAYIECNDRVGSKLSAGVTDYSDQFTSVLGPMASQHDVFNACGLPIMEAALEEQRNACLFAYGQTGSGKTFSMYGAEGGKNPSKLDGVVPATVSELFRRTIGQEKVASGPMRVP